MNTRLYEVPDSIRESCDQLRYSRWLHRKAVAHAKRDRKRFGPESCTVAGYKGLIHAAVCAGGERDYYTDEPLDWHLVSTYANAESSNGKALYKTRFALLPTLDHTWDEHGQPKFVICSWRVNDAKSHLTEGEFFDLCRKVLKHRAGE